jgi:MFS family permease
MVGLDNTIVNVGLPEIGKSLHTSVAGLQWTVAGYTIVLASLLMFSGAAADRIGRRTAWRRPCPGSSPSASCRGSAGAC